MQFDDLSKMKVDVIQDRSFCCTFPQFNLENKCSGNP